jgi:hypothetical protein
MLIEHRVHDVHERLVGIEYAVPPREQIAFQPPLALMFAQHFDDPAVRRQPFIVGRLFTQPLPGGSFEHRV